MLHKTINLSSDGRVNLRTYIHDNNNNNFQEKKRPALIILPGGAYSFLSNRESEPVAITFMKEGFNTFVLNYSVGDYSEYPNPLEEISKAIWIVRQHSDEWGIISGAIALMGFSAGAAIAAMAGTQWNTPGLADRLEIPQGMNKPNAVVFGYGASLTSTIMDDPTVFKPKLGKIATDRTPELDIVNYVGPHTPPFFIWHTRYDNHVPAINPLLLAEALQKYDLPYELHLFQTGQHGMSVSNNLSAYNEPGLRHPNVDMWVPLCTNWLYVIFNLSFL